MGLRSRLKLIVVAVCGVIPSMARDAVGLGGAMLFVYGVWLVFEPAAFMVGGLILFAAAWLAAARAR
jgi:hypothetical protein